MEINETSESFSTQENFFTHKMSTKHTRVAVVGNVDAGKSTLIGSLTTGVLDDGRGQSRRLIMKHKHEIETGRTSTIGNHLLGFDINGKSIVASNMTSASKPSTKTEEDIALEAHSLVSLLDLAGHEKYLKTTIHGVSSGMLDYALVLVNAKRPPTHMTLEHIRLICAVGIPFVIVLTKIDSCPKHALKNTKEEMTAILRSPEIQKKPFAVKSDGDIDVVKDKMHAIAPVVTVSSVTGEGFDLLNRLLFSLPKRRRHQKKVGRMFEFLLEDTFYVTGVGIVVSGFVNAGKISTGNTVWVGPLNNGDFLKTSVKSIHVSRNIVKTTFAGNTACLALSLTKKQRKLMRKGMVILEKPMGSSRVFEAEMFIMNGYGLGRDGGTTIRNKYQTVVHILHIKQTATIENIELVKDTFTKAVPDLSSADRCNGVTLRPGHRAKISFRFLKQEEFIRPGMRILFRDGCMRACGIVTAIDGET